MCISNLFPPNTAPINVCGFLLLCANFSVIVVTQILHVIHGGLKLFNCIGCVLGYLAAILYRSLRVLFTQCLFFGVCDALRTEAPFVSRLSTLMVHGHFNTGVNILLRHSERFTCPFCLDAPPWGEPPGILPHPNTNFFLF